MAKISVDEDCCIGCGACVSACEEGFRMEDNKSVPIKKQVDTVSCQKEAAEICPVNCISIK